MTSKTVEIALNTADLAHLRFAHSPMRELLASLLVLQNPSLHHVYRPWLIKAMARIRHCDIAALTALSPDGSIPYDFLSPHPVRPWGVLTDELAAMSATPADTVRSQIEHAHPPGTIPPTLRGLYEDPPAHLPALAERMATYWRHAIQPVWPRLRALCVADIALRMEQFAARGLARVLDDLHGDVSFDDGQLRVRRTSVADRTVDVNVPGILLIPCAFSWPTLNACSNESGPVVLSYPPRGVADLCGNTATEGAEALHALMGRTRSALLATLSLPATTTGLACRLELSPAAVSQHLQVLKTARLVEAHRRGREVLYQRTSIGSALLTAVSDEPGDP